MDTFDIPKFNGSVVTFPPKPLKNPNWMEVELLNGGEFKLQLTKDNFNTTVNATRANPNGGWHTFHFHEGGEFGPGIQLGDYTFRIVSDVKMDIRGGTIYYNK